MNEVEVLIRLSESKEKALKKLNGLEFHGIKKTKDIYFHDPKRNNLTPDKNGRLHECFRLRIKGKDAFLTYKKDFFNKKGNWIHSDECETKIFDTSKMMKLIQKLGFEKLVEIENNKHTFSYGKYEIVFEEVKNLGLFLEVEKHGHVRNDSVLKCKKEIREFIKKLGFKGEELDAGKPELMLRKLKEKRPKK
jgi:predicted adenylyl cyclase CyaB